MEYLFRAVGKEPFPMELIAYKGYDCIPNQRTDQDSYTNTRGGTVRSILPELRSTVVIKTLDNLTLQQVKKIQESFPNRDVVTAEYWNNETQKLETARFYMPSIKFTIKETGKGVLHDPLELTFIAYEGDR